VDEKSLRNLANHVIDGGVNGLFVMGTTGEFQSVPFDEQQSAIEAVSDEAGTRALVVAGVTGNSVEETLRNVTEVGSLENPPHALVVAPLCYHSNRKLPQHMELLSSLSKLPVLLYNNIGIVTRRWKRRDIIPDLVGRMAALPNVVGIKDSSGNLEYLGLALKHASPGFRVFQGEESLILPALQHGACGAVPSLGNIFPRLCTALYAAHLGGEAQTAEDCQRAICQIGALYPNTAVIPPILKAYLEHQGIIATSMSHIRSKGDIDAIGARLVSTIQALENAGC
jgi:4-hydroxy-tetrahydrodipicolinate synthase